MTDKVNLLNFSSFQNDASAVALANANNTTLTTAFDNTLSRDGTSPNQMGSTLDMNSNNIINLPNPVSTSSPLRLQDLNTFIGGGTIEAIPVGGTTGQSLTKNSNTNYDVGWTSVPTLSGTNTWTGAQTFSNTVAINNTLTVNGSVIDTSGNITSPLLKLAGSSSGTTTIQPAGVASGTLTVPSATDTLVARATTDTLTNKTLTSPVISTITNTGTLTLPTSTDTLVGRATTDSLTNKTLVSPTITTGLTATNLVTNASLAQMNANTIKGNNTGSLANAADLTIPQVQILTNQAYSEYVVYGVNLNSVADTAIAISFPTGFTSYSVISVRVWGASTSLTSAQAGVFSTTAGGGTGIAAAQALSGITATTANTAASTIALTLIATNSTTMWTFTPLYFRCTTAQGSAATANVTLAIQYLG